MPVRRSAGPRPRLIVAGMPRSGTSWLARVLAHAGGMTYVREPDNAEFVPGADRRFDFLYLTAGDDHPYYQGHIHRALHGRVATRFTLRDDPRLGPLVRRLGPLGDRLGAALPIQRHVLVKFVFTNLALDWLADAFPDVPQVYVVRHPCGQFESWRRLGMDPRPTDLLEDPRLVEDHLAPFAAQMRATRSFWQRAGASWGATNRIVLRQTERRPGLRTIVPFEWLCEDPQARFRALFDRVGLAFTPRVERFLRDTDRPTDDRPFSTQRDTRAQATKFQAALEPAEIEACRGAAEPFALPYYPDFAPLPCSAPLWPH